MTEPSTHSKIISYIDKILKSPKKDLKYFYFDKGRTFVMDGNRLKLLPTQFSRLYNKTEFFIRVDPDEKRVLYYAYDIGNMLAGNKVNAEEGIMMWDVVEDLIYNFLGVNIKDLCNDSTPYLNQTMSQTPSTSQQTQRAAYEQSNYGSHRGANSYQSNYSSNYTNTYVAPAYTYGTPEYKAREAFYDVLWAKLKDNKTAFAIEHIQSSISKLCTEKKFKELDFWIKNITLDKLNTSTMISILNSTVEASSLLKERKEFFTKVKTHLTKIKPAYADMLLKDLEDKPDAKESVSV